MSDHTSDIEVDIHQICKEGDHQKLLEVVESQGFFPEMLLESDDEGYLPIHLALIYNKIECVSILLALNVDHQIPYQGFMPIHLAMGRSGFKSLHAEIISTVLLLLKHQQDVTLRDRLGRTALHIACATGIPDLIPIFLQSGIKPDLKDFSGKMAIHYAIENHESECLRQILQEGGSDMLFCTDGRGDKPVHLAVRCGSWDCFHILISLGSEEMLNENNEYEQTPEDVAKNCGIYQEYLNIKAGSQVSSQKYTGTLIVTDDLCKFHAAIPESLKTPENLYKQLKTQPENPKRLEIMLDKPFGTLLADEFSELEWIKTVEKANISDILRVHEYSYISQIKTHINKLNPESFPQKFDIDTVVSSESYACALIAANCAIKAVDAVLQGDYKNAFCAVRPPGHHVGPYGAVYSEEDPGSKSTGFCLFNNVAIAAAYAKSQYHKLVKKIAVVDFDVHHGNGTEEIVKNLIPSIIAHSFNSVPFAGTLTSHSYKPWLNEDDAKNVLFISSHGYGSDSFGKLYPASGTYVSGADLHPGGVLNVPLSKQTDSFIFRQSNI
jgi:acetoin utilization deacetylase AcuC-like enzyme/ankyrin repeat protein